MLYAHQLRGQSYSNVDFKKLQVFDLMSLAHLLVQSLEQLIYFLNNSTGVKIAMLLIFPQFALIDLQTFSDSFNINRKVDGVEATWFEKQLA